MTAKFKKGENMKDMEQMLLNNASLDELIRMKIEEEFKTELKTKKQKPEVVTLTDLKEVPREKIFTKDSTFRVYNRNNKTETFIDGVQADAMIGLKNAIREQFLNKTLTAFSTDDTFVKFESTVIKNV